MFLHVYHLSIADVYRLLKTGMDNFFVSTCISDIVTKQIKLNGSSDIAWQVLVMIAGSVSIILYRLPIGNYDLWFAHKRLPIADNPLQVIHYILSIPDYKLRVTHWSLPIADYLLRINYWG